MHHGIDERGLDAHPEFLILLARRYRRSQQLACRTPQPDEANSGELTTHNQGNQSEP
jgi:hypothetical protein